MTPLASLWLPIVLTTVFIFLASSIIHMVMPWHKSDFAKVPGEDAFRRAVGPLRIPPGDYMTPYCTSGKDMASEEFKTKIAEGPVLFMTVRANAQPSMAPMFIGWTLAILAVTAIVAWVAGSALPVGAEAGPVWHFTGPAAFLAYGFANWPASIWYGHKWSTAVKGTVDALIYAAITAVTFGWMWPGA